MNHAEQTTHAELPSMNFDAITEELSRIAEHVREQNRQLEEAKRVSRRMIMELVVML